MREMSQERTSVLFVCLSAQCCILSLYKGSSLTFSSYSHPISSLSRVIASFVSSCPFSVAVFNLISVLLSPPSSSSRNITHPSVSPQDDDFRFPSHKFGMTDLLFSLLQPFSPIGQEEVEICHTGNTWSVCRVVKSFKFEWNQKPKRSHARMERDERNDLFKRSLTNSVGLTNTCCKTSYSPLMVCEVA